jgi:hypothetical protein
VSKQKPKIEPKAVSDKALSGVSQYTLIGLGATQAYCGEFPRAFESLGVRPRDEGRNTYLGLTVTRPSKDVVYFGFAYDDRRDGLTDEDIYALDVRHKTLSYYGRGRVEKIDPRFKGTHHGEKRARAVHRSAQAVRGRRPREAGRTCPSRVDPRARARARRRCAR